MKKVLFIFILCVTTIILMNKSKESISITKNKDIASLPNIIVKKMKLKEDIEDIKKQVLDLKLSVTQKKELGEKLYHIGKVKELSAKQKIEIYKLAKQNLLEGNKYE